MKLSIGKFTVHVSLAGFAEGHMDFTLTSLNGGGGDSELNNGAVGFKVSNNGHELKVTSDLIGGYRIYYWQQGNDIYISDDIYEVLPATTDFETDENEKRYCDRHGYGLADRTFRKGLSRLPPSSTLCVDEHGLSVEHHWPLGAVKRTPDERKYVDAVRKAIDDSLLQLKGTDRKIVLCFSGGTDSLYAAKRMQKLGIDFDLVHWIGDSESEATAAKGAHEIGKPLVLMDVSDYTEELKEAVAHEMYFDRHPSVHYVGCKKIVELYGSDTILVNGQNSDSILTYGPSETKFTSYWKRYLMYGKSYFQKWIYKTIIEAGFQRRFVVPRTEDDMDRALLDNFRYCLLLDKNEPQDYREYLNRALDDIKHQINFTSQNNLWMYLKTHTHIYGSDCQVVVNSARHFGLQLLLPFSTEQFMRASLMYKDDRKELRKPKYVLKQ